MRFLANQANRGIYIPKQFLSFTIRWGDRRWEHSYTRTNCTCTPPDWSDSSIQKSGSGACNTPHTVWKSLTWSYSKISKVSTGQASCYYRRRFSFWWNHNRIAKIWIRYERPRSRNVNVIPGCIQMALYRLSFLKKGY